MTDEERFRQEARETMLTRLEEREMRQAFRQASAAPARLLDPLSRKVRLRLWLHRRVDDAAYWLVCHNHCTAARRLWQLFRMW